VASIFVLVIAVFVYSSSARAFPENIPSTVYLESSDDLEILPSLNDFITQVRHDGVGPQGVWADDLFAFRIDATCWGCVPTQMNTAGFSTLLDSYQGVFIHNYLWGDKLYAAESGSLFAVVYADEIKWFEVIERIIYEAPPSSETCTYKGEGPFTVWGTTDQKSISAREILNAHYTADQWAMQTSMCEDGKVGFMVLSAKGVEVEIINSIEKDASISVKSSQSFAITINIEKE